MGGGVGGLSGRRGVDEGGVDDDDDDNDHDSCRVRLLLSC